MQGTGTVSPSARRSGSFTQTAGESQLIDAEVGFER